MKSLKHNILKIFCSGSRFCDIAQISATVSAAYLQIISGTIASLNLITYSLFMIILASDWTSYVKFQYEKMPH